MTKINGFNTVALAAVPAGGHGDLAGRGDERDSHVGLDPGTPPRVMMAPLATQQGLPPGVPTGWTRGNPPGWAGA